MSVETSEQDIHPFDKYLKWLSSPRIMLSAWLVTLLVGVALSSHYEKWALLPRFGAIGVAIGTLLTLSPVFAKGIYKSNAIVGLMADRDSKGKLTVTSEESRSLSNAILTGIVLIVLSSVVNAFGDLIPLLVS